KRLLIGNIVDPMVDSQGALARRFILTPRRCGDHLLLCGRKRTDFVHIIFNGRSIAVGRHQSRESFYQVPRWTVGHCLETGVDVLFWASSPPLSARHQLEFDDSFSAEVDCDLTIRIL